MCFEMSQTQEREDTEEKLLFKLLSRPDANEMDGTALPDDALSGCNYIDHVDIGMVLFP